MILFHQLVEISNVIMETFFLLTITLPGAINMERPLKK